MKKIAMGYGFMYPIAVEFVSFFINAVQDAE
jgi:hypothetical protein